MKYTIFYECNSSCRMEQEVVEADKILQAVRILKAAGILATVRENRGQDIFAACGMLSLRTGPHPPA